MIVLQEMLFPNLETCPEFKMYFRVDAGKKHAYADAEAGVIRVPQWCSLDMDTYFNSFSIGKWLKYTTLDNLKLRLDLIGEFRVQLIRWQRLKKKCTRFVVAEQICHAGKGKTFELAFPGELVPRGVYACALYALSDDCAFAGGRYVTEASEDALNTVDIALDICTFKREKFVEKNLEMLRRDILENQDSPLRDHLEVFISDNGQTLDRARLSSDSIHIYPNKNVGGAGGFTRGMIEVIDAPRAFSHVLLMDDDVLINSDAIVRTYRFLRMLKPEYACKTVAGALLRLDKRYEQFESGAVMNSYILRPRKPGLDLRRIKHVLKNEQEETIHYNGWWYSCIPMTLINNDNLPLPFFVHRDDVEFALRTGSDILTLNGICLWHESFDNRYASSMEYYEVRNDMILYSLRKPKLSVWRIAYEMLHRVVGNVIRYRYNNCELIFKALEDYFAGPDRLILTDPEVLHKQILSMGDKLLPIEQLEIPFVEKKVNKGLKAKPSFLNTLRIYFLNGLFLPPKGDNVVNIGTPWPRNYYRRRAVLNYDEVAQKGFVSKRSFRKSMSAMFRCVGLMGRMILRYKGVSEAYRQAEPILTSRSFWNEYLDLK